MKYFSVAILAALLLATIVSAAPQSNGVSKEDADLLIEVLKCDISVIEEVSKEYGYGDQWAQFESKFKQYVDNAKKCIASINGDEEKFTDCELKAYAEIFALNMQYFAIINDEDFLTNYKRVSVENCG